ncbi:hypothetical protein TELCIR_08188 [Teladorsagia circumcincta]|uniref:Uncharacterized protein n=1 Tax=Teladorsagia circumcincta TaxID=45464 RepID=A0A2G9UIK6_TELCI|nr:hypothetical protein TELCIR_08188 [Teladorsagia circumcincta]
MMNGTLEECERWQLTDPAAVREYEEYKCKHLREAEKLSVRHSHVRNPPMFKTTHQLATGMARNTGKYMRLAV